MGILVSAIMGLALTAPISSAALAIMLNLGGVERRCSNQLAAVPKWLVLPWPATEKKRLGRV